MSNPADNAPHGQPAPQGDAIRSGNGRDPILDAEIRLAWMTGTRDREVTINLVDEARRLRGELEESEAENRLIGEVLITHYNELARLRDLIASIPPLAEVIPVLDLTSRPFLPDLNEYGVPPDHLVDIVNAGDVAKLEEYGVSQAEIDAAREYEALRSGAKSALAALGVRVRGAEASDG